ncbi:MAG: hypothetical protein PQJ60_08200, partial [Spirochaetales bacterium]|nr:hypothetical protein [Spirochaetales bacterium]
TRNLADRFNRRYGELFPLPQPCIPEKTGRIMNLLEPDRKMDKSHENPHTYISLLDSPETIRKKINRAKTDGRGDFDLNDRESGIANLVRIYSALTGLGENTVVWEYEYRGYGDFKKDLAQIISEELKPIREEYARIRPDGERLKKLLARGREKAADKSEPLMGEVKKAVGLIPTC